MATNPSKAELFDQLAKACKVRDELYKFGSENSDNFVDLMDAVVQALEGEHANEVLSALKNQRTSLNALLNQSVNYIIPIIKKIAEVGYSINTTGLTQSQIVEKIKDAMDAASETIASRELSFGSVSAGGSNVGDGTILRCTKDRHNNDLEGGEVGVVKIEVTADKNNAGTTPGREKARIYGSGIQKVDNVELNTATNLSQEINFVRSDNSILQNASFDDIEDSINSVEQTGWRLSDTADFTKIIRNASSSSGDVFRYTQGSERTTVPKGAALRFDDNGSISQYVARSGKKLRRDVPYFLVVRWMRKSTADGTLTVNLGSQSVNVDVTTGTNDVWNNLVLGNGATNKGWYDVFFEDWEDTSVSPSITLGVQIKVALASRTTGTVIIDEIILVPGQLFNGVYYACVSEKSNEDVLVGDNWTFTDAYSGASYAGAIQETIRAITGNYLPHTSGVETYADA